MEVRSTRASSSHHHNPFAILCAPETTETDGPCYGGGPGIQRQLFHSAGEGSDESGTSDSGNRQRAVYLAAGSPGGVLHAGGGDVLQRPGPGKAVLQFPITFVREHLCRGKYKHARRPVLLNNWEATYFDFNSEKILEIARGAADLGVEMLVLDDGWFGKRDDDTSGLGDWYVNEKKLPGGLKPLADQINALGLKFGLWFEPEAVSEDSDLYRAASGLGHPDS